MNNNISSTNFRGSYLMNFPKNKATIREAFEKTLGSNGKIILEDFGAKDKVLYVLRDSKDYDVANFIKNNRIRFQYMPEINTGARLDSEQPEQALEYINKMKPTIISRMDELIKFVTENRYKNRAQYNAQKSLLGRVCEGLFINVKGKEVKDSFGITTIEDTVNNGLVKMSPKSKYGFRYIYVKPANKYEDVRRLAIDSEGNRVTEFTTPEGIKKFDEHFKKAIDNHLHREPKGNRKLKYS